MSTKIFVNLPVKDLDRSVAFFTAAGFTFNPQFTDDNATCMVISDDIYAMLLVEPFFRTFTEKEIADTATTTEAIVALGLDSKEQVDRIAEAAVAGGGTAAKRTEHESPMYTRSFFDLDGHHWELFWLDPALAQG
ncbi:VOC family protein [Streptomyces sp. NPDC088197]|uniref:VOC family protein n=1 Tax=unclassified Streptomyces TaxID=2593676 RepID=UPI0036E3D35E